MGHRRVKLTDSEWDVWDVRPEQKPHRVGNELSDGWLCFQSGAERRRLHPIPENWEEQTEPEIERLFESATPVVPARSIPDRTRSD